MASAREELTHADVMARPMLLGRRARVGSWPRCASRSSASTCSSSTASRGRRASRARSACRRARWSSTTSSASSTGCSPSGRPRPTLAPGAGRRAFGRVELRALAAGVTPYTRDHRVRAEPQRAAARRRARRPRARGAVGASRSSGSRSSTGERRVIRGGHPSSRRSTGPDGEVTVRARYCIGADGSHSPVRESLGIPFEGVTNAYTFYVADAGGRDGPRRRRGQPADHGGALPARVPDGPGADAPARHRARRRPRRRAGTSRGGRALAHRARVRGGVRARRLVHDLPAAPPARAAVPRRAVLPRRRRRAHPLAGRRAGHEHGAAGGAQPRLRARRRARRRHARPPTRPVRGRAPPGRQDPRRDDRPAFAAITADVRIRPVRARARRCRSSRPLVVRLLPPPGRRRRIFGYLSQTRIHYRMSPQPDRAATTSSGAACRGRATTSTCCAR